MAQVNTLSARERESALDLRISTTFVRGGRPAFWRALLGDAASRGPSLRWVWLFEPSLMAHPSVNPLAQLLELGTSTGAALVYTLPSGERLPGAPHCVAMTSGAALLGPSVILTSDLAKNFYGRVLARLDNNATEIAEYGCAGPGV